MVLKEFEEQLTGLLKDQGILATEGNTCVSIGLKTVKMVGN